MEWNNSHKAPRVYSEVGRIRIGDRLSEWGYITEVAKIITPHGACECDDCCYIEDEYVDEISELQNNIERAGYYFSDAHVGNVGYITRNGKKIMACIDTGEESVQPDNDSHDYCSCAVCRIKREYDYA